MKQLIFAVALAGVAATALAADVGVSVSIGQPGFYGQVDIGDYLRPQVVYQQPVIIERSYGYAQRAPIYLNVPPGHAKKWSKHCGAYSACGQRVYFVQNNWYEQQYVPHYRARNAGYRSDRNDNRHDGRYDRNDNRRDGRNDRIDNRHDDRNDRRDDRGDDRGKSNGNGRGNKR